MLYFLSLLFVILGGKFQACKSLRYQQKLQSYEENPEVWIGQNPAISYVWRGSPAS